MKYNTNEMFKYIDMDLEQYGDHIDHWYDNILCDIGDFSSDLCYHFHHRYTTKWQQYFNDIILPYINNKHKQWLINHKLREIDSDFQ